MLPDIRMNQENDFSHMHCPLHVNDDSNESSYARLAGKDNNSHGDSTQLRDRYEIGLD